jgi:hypothetical protein
VSVEKGLVLRDTSVRPVFETTTCFARTPIKHELEEVAFENKRKVLTYGATFVLVGFMAIRTVYSIETGFAFALFVTLYARNKKAFSGTEMGVPVHKVSSFSTGLTHFQRITKSLFDNVIPL